MSTLACLFGVGWKDDGLWITWAREPESTANNLGLIRDARAAHGSDVGWLDEVIAALREARGSNAGCLA